MEKRIAVVYSLKRHRTINGTLFYCFEYFLFLRKLGASVVFVIHNASVTELHSIAEIFKERYIFDKNILSEFVILDKLSDFYRFKFHKVLFLDVHSLELLGMLTSAEIICYSNISNGKITYKEKRITYYGCYDYQDYDIQELLKFDFSLYRSLGVVEEGILVVEPNMDYKNVVLPEYLSNGRIIYKKPNVAIGQLFEQFTTLFYVQAQRLDFNNRLIPECFFYEKEIIIQSAGVLDSVTLRYDDIKKNGIEKYQLSVSDKMVSHLMA